MKIHKAKSKGLVHRFEVWGSYLGPWRFLPCFGGVSNTGPYSETVSSGYVVGVHTNGPWF